MEKQSIENKIGIDYRLKALEKMKQDIIDNVIYHPIALGTLQELEQKENTMYHDQDTSAGIFGPRPRGNVTKASSTQANIDLQVNMPAAKDPTEKSREHLLRRAAEAQNAKYNELRTAFNFIDDDQPDTFKNFIQRIKDGKFTTEMTEKEQAERKFWSTDRILEEITWRDPARVEDEAGFEAANKLLNQATNDVSDEIIVKTPDQGLEALRAFQAKTFN